MIDGQQRLTTLTLLLAAIRDYRDEKEPEAEAGIEIHNRFLVNQYKKGRQHIELVPTQADRASYAAVIKTFLTWVEPTALAKHIVVPYAVGEN